MNISTTVKAVHVIDDVLTLALMASSLATRLSKVNGLILTVQQEGRKPTADEMAVAEADYETARSQLLADADRIQATGPTA